MYDRKEMFKATCSECGDNCEVPFKPTGSKPVFCSSCFGQQGNSSHGGSGDRHRRPFDRNSRSGDRNMFQATCDKCGNKCEVPFKPTAGKPIYCNDCFGKNSDRGDRRGGGDRHGGRDRRGGGSNDQLSQQLSSVSSKLDKILSLLASGDVKKESSAKETTDKFASKKPTTKKKTKVKASKKSAKKVVKKKK